LPTPASDQQPESASATPPSPCSKRERSGRWTPEEEFYARLLMEYFKEGWLDLPVGALALCASASPWER
jgi:hypothetical protein